jgi:hypothetical protein
VATVQALEVQAGEVWLDGLGRRLTILRFERGRTYYRINDREDEVRMRSHLFAWQLAKHNGKLVTLAPLATY